MESSGQENSEYESQMDAAGAPPPDKSDNCHDCDDIDVNVELKLELESVQPEVEAASAMRGAAELIDEEIEQLKRWMHTREHTTEGILDDRLAVATTSSE
ncbi:unnamed protein product [Echinostoma caproni]|uniref:Shootin-1 n=1 Tax=Echinostoma caproni TaxID=27848 RepID=A0A183AYV9_9TREM|nr:unnamed protein product [Echinostoma caproni]